MNERIKELIKQSGLDYDELWTKDQLAVEKFAELIVRECAQVATDSNQSKNRAVGQSVGDVVRKHFGVEE